MPRYDYRCQQCVGTFEATHSMSSSQDECGLCGGGPVQRLISAPMINSVKSSSPTGAMYEKMSKKEIIDKEAEPLAAMEQQEGMAEKLAIMYGGKLD
jgi:putative FmdB family regulatory protein